MSVMVNGYWTPVGVAVAGTCVAVAGTTVGSSLEQPIINAITAMLRIPSSNVPLILDANIYKLPNN